MSRAITPTINRMSQPLKKRLVAYLKTMAANPQAQIKRLAIGTFISLIASILQIFSSQWESQILFYILSFIMLAGVIYALPGYLGIWMWRMRDTLFRNNSK
ncbi:MAG: hypothetical protein Q9M92_00930 [Enterobacterales bacterium]|nr:hypothetical protein [Enterobacterales bacterium]